MRKDPARYGKPILSIPEIVRVRRVLESFSLNTVCDEARCPNRGECYASGTATFLILGTICTRDCRFCAVNRGIPLPVDPGEPGSIAQASRHLGLRYVVITSVTRDDLSDGGAGQFVKCIHKIRELQPDARVEVLTPDFDGDGSCIDRVVDAKPVVYNHNIETVPGNYVSIRPRASFRRSLHLLERVKRRAPDMRVKSGFMVGLGERPSEVFELVRMLREVGCDYLTIGQYLPPTRHHIPVREYVSDARFSEYRQCGEDLGFARVAAGPFVRSSYHAREFHHDIS